MFLEYYGLTEQPFGVSPDPRFLFPTPTHREAFASLYYGVTTGRGFLALIARPGTGKTTLMFELLRSLRNRARTVFLFQTQSSARDLMRNLLADLGDEHYDGDLVRGYARLNEVLLDEARAGRRFVLVIDEAQNLDRSLLEVVRMLSNFETSSDKLLQIILAGQPQLASKLAAPDMVQLRQRLAIVTQLKPLTPQESAAYIRHRLYVAGYSRRTPLFTPGALQLLVKYGAGIPRSLNTLSFNALSLGCATKKPRVDEAIIREVLQDQDLKAVIYDQFSPVVPDARPALAQAPHPAKRWIGKWVPKLVFGSLLACGAIWISFVGKNSSGAREASPKPVAHSESYSGQRPVTKNRSKDPTANATRATADNSPEMPVVPGTKTLDSGREKSPGRSDIFAPKFVSKSNSLTESASEVERFPISEPPTEHSAGNSRVDEGMQRQN